MAEAYPTRARLGAACCAALLASVTTLWLWLVAGDAASGIRLFVPVYAFGLTIALLHPMWRFPLIWYCANGGPCAGSARRRAASWSLPFHQGFLGCPRRWSSNPWAAQFSSRTADVQRRAGRLHPSRNGAAGHGRRACPPGGLKGHDDRGRPVAAPPSRSRKRSPGRALQANRCQSGKSVPGTNS